MGVSNLGISKDDLAINGGEPYVSTQLPKWPIYDDNESLLINNVLESGNWWRNQGSEVKKFEKEFAEYQSAKYALTVSNGTQAIEIALESLGIKEDDEVIIPAFTFFSTASAVLRVGATPVVVDVLPDTYCIDPSTIKSAITEKTKAIIPVHIAGHPANMDEIIKIAKLHDLFVIEDAAHAHGAEWNGIRVGSLYSGGTFSFQNAKLMTSGEGGIIITNDELLIKNCLLYSNCGRLEADRTYQHQVIGTNGRLSEFQGAILRAQLQRLDEQINIREENYKHFENMINGVNGIIVQKTDKHVTRHSHYMIMFKYDETMFGGLSRNKFVECLVAEGVPANISYQSIHRLPVFKNKKNETRWKIKGCLGVDGEICCPISEGVSDNVVCLNHRVLLGNKELIDKTVGAIEKIRKYAVNHSDFLKG